MMDFNRGDLVWANLEPVKPGEQGRKRPCVIVSYNAMNHSKHPCIIVCPVTAQQNVHRDYPTHTLLPMKTVPEITKDSIIMAEQIRTIAKERIDQKKNAVALPTSVIAQIEKCIRKVLDLG